MSDEQLNGNNSHDDGVESPPKRQKRDDNDEDESINTPESETAPKSITTISETLVKKIFSSLDLESLMNVTHTCKHLQSIAIEKFGDDFELNEIRLCPFATRRHSQASGIRVSPIYYIQVNGLDFCYPFLRCFGSRILELNVSYNNNLVGTQNQTNHLDRYINQYCADSLTSIVFDCKRTFSSENFTKPFKNVTEVQIIGGNLGDQFPNFANWFPNLRHLEMWFEIIVNHNATAVLLPNLTHLSIKIQGLNGHFTNENVTDFLHANPQLESLTIYSDNPITKTPFGMLLNMINRHPMIRKFKLGECLADVNKAEVKRLINEHPLMEELDLQEISFSSADALTLLRNLKSLKLFILRLPNRFECSSLVRQLTRGWKHHFMSEERTHVTLRKSSD